MPQRKDKEPKRSIGWMGLKRGHRARPGEWFAEKTILLVSLSAIVIVFLIFLFVAREALPVALGHADTSLASKTHPPEDLDRMSKADLMEYLELTPKQFAQMDRETL